MGLKLSHPIDDVLAAFTARYLATCASGGVVIAAFGSETELRAATGSAFTGDHDTFVGLTAILSATLVRVVESHAAYIGEDPVALMNEIKEATEKALKTADARMCRRDLKPPVSGGN